MNWKIDGIFGSRQKSVGKFLMLASLGVGCAFATPTLSVSPSTSTPTWQARALGEGWIVGHTVQVYLQGVPACPGTVDVGGSFKCNFYIPKTMKPGTYTVVAKDGAVSKKAKILIRTDWKEFKFSSVQRGYNPYENILGTSNVSNLIQNCSFPYPSASSYTASSPAVYKGMAFFGGPNDYKMHAMDASTCALKWDFSALGNVASSPVVSVANNMLYFGSNDTYVYALNIDNGGKWWSFKTGSIVSASPTLDTSTGTLYVGSQDFKFYAIDAATGVQKWVFPTGGKIMSSAAIANGQVCFGSNDGKFRCLDANNGTLLWDFSTGNTTNIFDSSPAIYAGVVYFGGNNNYFYVRDITANSTLWQIPVNGTIHSSPLLVGGNVYFGSTEGRIYSYTTGGTFNWLTPITGDVRNLEIANGVIYASYSGGPLHTLNAASGALLQKYSSISFTNYSYGSAIANGLVYWQTQYGLYVYKDPSQPAIDTDWGDINPDTLVWDPNLIPQGGDVTPDPTQE